MTRYGPHIYIVPEDDRDRQLANGFVLHDQVTTTRVQVTEPAGGWREVLKVFVTEYIHLLREDQPGHLGYVVMLIDFDGCYEDRRKEFDNAIPQDLKQRVFVVGPKETPEKLKGQLGRTYEKIGLQLADECFSQKIALWDHEHLKHNGPDRDRMLSTVRPILFPQ